METHKLKVEYIDLGQITPYENNAKEHPPEQIEQIKASIKEFGFNDPIATWNGQVVAGHGRLQAAKELGQTKIPVIKLDGLTDEQRRAYGLIHNQLTMNSGFDADALAAELASISDIDMAKYSFTTEEIMGSRADAVEDDGFDDAPPDAPPVAQYGDIYILGRHRLMCGDSTKADDVSKLMQGDNVHLLLTDPPYGVKRDKGFGGAGGFSGKGAPIKRREYTDAWDDKPIDKSALDNGLAIAEKAIIFGGNFFTDKLPVGNFWIVWDKNNTMPSFGDCELAWTNIKRNSVKKYEYTWNGLIGKEENRVHPTQKPVKLLAMILEDFTKPNDKVLDLFGGSGATLIACEKMGLNCFMMEREPKYVDIIIKRWEKETGGTAIKC